MAAWCRSALNTRMCRGYPGYLCTATARRGLGRQGSKCGVTSCQSYAGWSNGRLLSRDIRPKETSISAANTAATRVFREHKPPMNEREYAYDRCEYMHEPREYMYDNHRCPHVHVTRECARARLGRDELVTASFAEDHVTELSNGAEEAAY